MLKILLAEDGRTQTKIAELAGIDPTTLSKIVTGERPPTEDQVRALAKILQVHPSVLTAEISRDDLVGVAEQKLKSLPVDPVRVIPGPSAHPPILGSVPAGDPDARDGVEIPPAPKKKPPKK